MFQRARIYPIIRFCAKGMRMLKGLSAFLSNTDFYNPVDKPLHDLLSRKEKIKGRVLPLLGQVSLFALSVGMSAMGGTVAEAVLAVGVLASVVSYLRHSSLSNYKRKLDQENIYDPDVPQDVTRFAQNYPQQADLPAQLRRLGGEAGIEKTPLIHVGKNTDYAAIVDLSFGKRQDLLLELNPKTLVAETPALLTHVLAHEIGHARLGHTGSTRAVISGTAIATHISVGVQMGLTGNYLGGIFYSVAAIAAHKIAGAKRQQYKERECDRHALLLSGVGAEAADFFEKESAPILDNPPLALRAAFGALNTFQSLAAAHPSHKSRADYMRSFNDANRGYLDKVRLKNGIVPPMRPRVRTV